MGCASKKDETTIWSTCSIDEKSEAAAADESGLPDGRLFDEGENTGWSRESGNGGSSESVKRPETSDAEGFDVSTDEAR